MIVLNDLYDYNLKIFQDNEKFKFSLDSLLLAEFIDIKKDDKNIIDFCSGNAPLPLILSKKYNINITGIEIQKEIFELAKKSINYNHLEDKINMLNCNILDINNYFKTSSIDVITCNPPFFKVDNSSIINIKNELAIARHELTITLKDIIELASLYLKNNGTFYLVHRPERLQEILSLANAKKLAVKKITFVSSKPEDNAIMVLMKFTKNGKIGTKVCTKVINRNLKSYQNIFN